MTLLRSIIIALPCLILLTNCAKTPTKGDFDPPPPPGKRSLGEFVDDQKIESSVYANINNSSMDFTETHIRVNSFKGTVLLTGQVPDEELKTEAGRAATETAGVSAGRVHNEIQLASNTTFFSRSNDSGLEAKIRVKLLANREFQGSKVKIVVEDRVVFIMGQLTRKEAQLATEIVSGTDGIEKVVRVIDFIN
ncbi:MAG TPA: BON domain-containing protein [Cellvibrionaceae bacterium]